jgi:AcrR family transcriptional regulator
VQASTDNPRAAHGAHTREQLLDAAERLFALRGFEATSVRDITSAAACNLAAVNYHFGGKRALYRETFRRRLAAVRDDRVATIARALAAPGADLESVLSSFAQAFLAPLLRDGGAAQLTELIAREMVDPQLPAELFVDEFVEPVQRALAAAIVALEPGVSERDARQCVGSMVAQFVHAVHRLRHAERAAAGRTTVPELPELVRHIVRFSVGGIRACRERPAHSRKGREKAR